MSLDTVLSYYQTLLISLDVGLEMFLNEFHVFFLFFIFGIFSMQSDELLTYRL